MPHPIWKESEVDKITIDHKEPITSGDKFAHFLIQALRVGFDLVSGYKPIFPW